MLPPPPPPIGRPPEPASEELLDVTAPLFMLAAPFAGFLAAAGYRWTAAETLMSAAVLIVLSLAFGTLLANISNSARTVVLLLLATVAADFLAPLPEFGAALAVEAGAWGPWTLAGAVAALYAAAFVVLFVFGRAAMLAVAAGFAALGVWLIIAGEAPRGRDAERAAAVPSDTALPPLLHVVLGAHNGLAGLAGKNAPELRRDLANMWTDRGFRVFTHAYGQYADFPDALSALLNFDAPDRDATWLAPPRGGERAAPRLAESALFRALAGRGYSVHVFGDDRLDLCIGAVAGVARCAARRGDGAAALAALDTPSLGKFGLLWALYLERSEIWTGLRALYRAYAVPVAGRAGLEAPAWKGGTRRLDSHAAAAGASELAAALARSGGGGRAWVAVLPLAEAPLAYGATCALIPEPDKWLDARDPALAPPRRNDAEGRLARHNRLNGQIACAHSRLAELVDALDANTADARATVLVHGLYGSGISEYEPTWEYEGVAREADFIDGFSTFLAVRAPGVETGVDSRPTPLQTALPAFFGREPVRGGPAIHLRARAGGALAARAPETVLGPAFAQAAE